MTLKGIGKINVTGAIKNKIHNLSHARVPTGKKKLPPKLGERLRTGLKF